MSKQYSYILFDNPDNVCSPPRGGEHVFSDSVKGNEFASQRPMTFIFEKFPSIDEWISILTMTLMLSRSKGSSGICMQVGHAKLHHTDSFSRKKGVEAAKANMTTQYFTIESLYLDPSTINLLAFI